MRTFFQTKKVVTKAISSATERRKAFIKMGFILSDEGVIGHDGTIYKDYWVFEQK